MPDTEYTNQIESDDFLAGLGFDEQTDDSDSEELTEETTAGTEGEAEQTSEAEQTGEGDKTEQDAQTETVEMFPRTVKFLGEDKQISMDEAVVAIQKGLNYDRMLEKYKGQVAGFENDRRVRYVEKLAREAGVDAGTYITMQENQAEYKALIDEYGDVGAVPPAIMEKFNKYSQSAIEKSKADNEAAKQRAYREEKAAEYMNFVEKHPEASGEMPKEVIDMVSAGESLEGAWAIHNLAVAQKELAQVKKDFEIYKANTVNKNSRIPGAKGKGREDKDDFLRGFFG